MVTGILEPPITNLGIKGIRRAAKRTLKWLDTIFIDATSSTVGGIFYYMYGRFLCEAAKITDGCQPTAAADEFQRIGDKWQLMAGMFKLSAGGSIFT